MSFDKWWARERKSNYVRKSVRVMASARKRRRDGKYNNGKEGRKVKTK